MSRISLSFKGTLEVKRAGEEPSKHSISASATVDENTFGNMLGAVQKLLLQVSGQIAKALEETAAKLPKPPAS